MKLACFYFLLFSLALAACRKNSLLTSPDARILPSADTLRFDTVFTGLGTVSRYFTVVNENSRPVNISSITLMGGNRSAFAINVNGSPGSSFGSITLDAFDSLYVFVKATINPDAQLQPFIVQDSIKIAYNGTFKMVQLQAYGQNARYINGGRIRTSTTWTPELPYVILQPLIVDEGAVLTLAAGVKVFCRATAPLLVNGTLKAMGTAPETGRITFRSDRLDEDYRDLPGTWPGIYFNPSSSANELRYTRILNAYQGIVVQGGADQQPAKLSLFSSQIENSYNFGLLAFNASVRAENCLIGQAGNDGAPGTGGSNLILSGGGNYYFDHCTVATYSNYYQNHKQPVLFIGNAAGTGSLPLNATFSNSILYGESATVQDEVQTSKSGNAPFSVAFRNVLFKAKNDPAGVSLINCIKNQAPLFDSIQTGRRLYNFRLKAESPAKDAGTPGGPATDLDGLPRPAGTKPDMGCYERQ